MRASGPAAPSPWSSTHALSTPSSSDGRTSCHSRAKRASSAPSSYASGAEAGRRPPPSSEPKAAESSATR